MTEEEKRERDRVYQREWRRRNPEKQKEIDKRYREKHRADLRDYQRVYYHKVLKHDTTEVEKRKQRTKKWVAENRERWNAYLREYRRRKKGE